MKKRLYPSFSVLIVDDEPMWLSTMSMALSGEAGINNIIECQDSREVMNIMGRGNVGIVLLDLTMPYLSGEELLSSIAEIFPQVLVIVVTGLNQVEKAVRCIKLGAYDYYAKTTEKDRIVTGILHAIRTIEMQEEARFIHNKMYSDHLETPEAFSDIITISDQMISIFRYIEAIAQSRQPVLITGESGVGKELIVKALYKAGQYETPMVTINLAGLDDNMFADTIFGHKRGAFTGAEDTRKGLAEQADESILFLDEIGDLSLASQVKLLRLLQEGEYYPVGSDRLKRTKARFALATNQDLLEKQRLGQFRKDLFYRLQTHHIHVPPLRERKEDIPLLFKYFVEQAAQEIDIPQPNFPRQVTTLLGQYDYPGNIRELRAMVFDEVNRNQTTLSLEGFKRKIINQPAGEQWQDIDNSDEDIIKYFQAIKRIPTLSEMEVVLISEAMRRVDGNQTNAARMLGISQSGISRWLRTHKQDM